MKGLRYLIVGDALFMRNMNESPRSKLRGIKR
jgi:hypothetical protein